MQRITDAEYFVWHQIEIRSLLFFVEEEMRNLAGVTSVRENLRRWIYSRKVDKKAGKSSPAIYGMEGAIQTTTYYYYHPHIFCSSSLKHHR